MVRRARLDAELVRRGLARSRGQAADLVVAGRVTIGGQVATKAATAIGPDDPLLVISDDDQPAYVSRGGAKLAGALSAFEPLGLEVAGRRCLDAGASTGGFTDVLLRAGAQSVVAVDVGYGQLAWSLQTDERVEVVDRTNVRDLTADTVGAAAELVVADLSFISLTVVLPALVRVASPDADLVLDGEAPVRSRAREGRFWRCDPRPTSARGSGRCSRPCCRRARPRRSRRRSQPASWSGRECGVLPVATCRCPARWTIAISPVRSRKDPRDPKRVARVPHRSRRSRGRRS